MIGFFLLLCLIGIAVMWSVVGVLTLKNRIVARREMKALLSVRSAERDERRRAYEQATCAIPTTSITAVLKKLEESAGFAVPDVALAPIPLQSATTIVRASTLEGASPLPAALPRIAAASGTHARRIAAATGDYARRIANVARRIAASTANVARRIAAGTRSYSRRIAAGTGSYARRISAATANHARRVVAATEGYARRIATVARRIAGATASHARRVGAATVSHARRIVAATTSDARRIAAATTSHARRIAPAGGVYARRIAAATTSHARRIGGGIGGDSAQSPRRRLALGTDAPPIAAATMETIANLSAPTLETLPYVPDRPGELLPPPNVPSLPADPFMIGTATRSRLVRLPPPPFRRHPRR